MVTVETRENDPLLLQRSLHKDPTTTTTIIIIITTTTFIITTDLQDIGTNILESVLVPRIAIRQQ